MWPFVAHGILLAFGIGVLVWMWLTERAMERAHERWLARVASRRAPSTEEE